MSFVDETDESVLRPIIPEILFELADGYPIDFIKYDAATQSFALEAEAQEFLLEFGGQVAFVVNMGQRRVGKTAFFNRCLDVSPAQSAFRENARGFKLWSKPIFSAAENKHLFFVDCEGRDDETYQEFCWIFGFFFSSLLLFSTSGEIDDATWTEFRPLEAVSKKVVFREGRGEAVLHVAAHSAPRLYWLVHDFPFADEPEAAAHPDAYMNAHLHVDGGDAHTKRQIAALFRNRTCLLLASGAPQTDEAVRVVKDAIFARAPVKLWDGAPLTARLAVYLMTVTLEQFGQGERLDFERILAEIARSETQHATEEALENFDAAARTRLGAAARAGEVFAALSEARAAAARAFFSAAEMLRRAADRGELIEQFRARVRDAEAQCLAAQESLALEHNDSLKEALEVAATEATEAAERAPKAIARVLGDALTQYAARSTGLDDVSPALVLASTLLEKALLRFPRAAPIVRREAADALDGAAKRKAALVEQKEALEREIAEVKRAVQSLQARSEGELGRAATLRRDVARESEQKANAQRVLERQREELQNLINALEKPIPKRGWCGL